VPIHDPIDFVCGNNLELAGPMLDGAGMPLDLTGATATWQLNSCDGLTNLVALAVGSGIEINTSGDLLVYLSAEQSATIPPGITTGSASRWADGRVFTMWNGVIRAGALTA